MEPDRVTESGSESEGHIQLHTCTHTHTWITRRSLMSRRCQLRGWSLMWNIGSGQRRHCSWSLVRGRGDGRLRTM